MLYMYVSKGGWKRIRKALRKKAPAILLSHLDEAIARAIGFTSYHDARVTGQTTGVRRLRLVREERLRSYLASRGYEDTIQSLDSPLFEQLGIPLIPATLDADGQLHWDPASFPILVAVTRLRNEEARTSSNSET